MVKEVNKQMVLDYIKYKETIDSCITEKNPEVIIDITIDNSTLLSMFRLEYPNVEFYAIEYPRNEGICSRIGSNTYYVDNEFFNFSKSKKVLSKFEEVMNTIKKQNPGKRIQILMNPPFNKGGDIWDICRKVTSSISCIGPLSMYKKGDRCSYIDKITTIDPSLFVGATITNNLCVTSCRETPNKDISYDKLLIESFDKNYKDYYLWNLNNIKSWTIKQVTYPKLGNLNRDTDFIEIGRCCTNIEKGGSGYGKKGSGYKYNIEKDRGITEQELTKLILLIKLETKLAKDNFCKWWYLKGKGKSLSSKTMIGLNIDTVSNTCSYAIPQINWETISDHPLWIEGDYDGAVLDVMGLKWNKDKTGVVKK